MTFALLAAAFVQGLMGFLHCPGMCGPFVIILNSGDGSRHAKNIVYNLGRTTSYATVGLGLGFAGHAANAFFLSPVAAFVGGALVIAMGVGYLVPSVRLDTGLRMPRSFTRVLADFMRQGGAVPSALLGVVSGLLPCGMLLPAYGLALSTGSPTSAALVMVLFSLGTYPALFSVGLGSHWFLRWTGGRGTARWVVGILLVVMGIGMVVLRAIGPELFHGHSHQHS